MTDLGIIVDESELEELTKSDTLFHGSTALEFESSPFSSGKRAALVIAHPGHELRLHHWLERARPLVFVLSDGSGRSGHSRLSSTAEVLASMGLTRGSIFGAFTDGDLYDRLLRTDAGPFLEIAVKLAEALEHERIEYVVGDAIEGYNPAHDLCRLMLNAATMMLRRRYGLCLGNYDFALFDRPDACPAELTAQAIWLRLDDKGFKRKVNAAAHYLELLSEVESAFNRNGVEAFRVECLRPVCHPSASYKFDEPPYYEMYGEKQVTAGFYPKVLRYREHMLPVAEALQCYANQVAG